MGPIGLWASHWLCPMSITTAPAVTSPVSVLSLSMLPVSLKQLVFLWGRIVSPMLNPQPGGPGGLYPSTPYQEFKTYAYIALGVTEMCKLPHHDKAVTPFRAVQSHITSKNPSWLEAKQFKKSYHNQHVKSFNFPQVGYEAARVRNGELELSSSYHLVTLNLN